MEAPVWLFDPNLDPDPEPDATSFGFSTEGLSIVFS